MIKNQCILPLAVAVAALISNNVMATDDTGEVHKHKPTDILTDGWQVNGYIRAAWRLNENGVSTGNQYGQRDYHLAATTGKNPNQVEFNVSKNTTFQNGVWSQLGIRAEYGNGDYNFYSSSGSEDSNNPKAGGDFEIKEAFVRLGGFSYLPEKGEVWAGRRFLNRESGILSREFWKQSSGVGFGYEQNDNGIAVVSVDLGERGPKAKDKTIHSLDLYSYNHKALGGSFNLDLKLMRAGDKSKFSPTESTDGVGMAITHKRNYYGFDGWTTSALAYGKGLAANRGVNFGQWSGATATVDSDKGNSIFFTSYGVLNINNSWQMGSEITYLRGKKIWGLGNEVTKGAVAGKETCNKDKEQETNLPDKKTYKAEGDTVDRLLIAFRPTYKVNDNFRWEFTGSFGYEKSFWAKRKVDLNGTRYKIGGAESNTKYYAAEVAGVFTVNSDFFGRPQIKPFFTYMTANSDNPIKDKEGWGTEFNCKKRTYQYGVEAEIWF